MYQNWTLWGQNVLKALLMIQEAEVQGLKVLFTQNQVLHLINKTLKKDVPSICYPHPPKSSYF